MLYGDHYVSLKIYSGALDKIPMEILSWLKKENTFIYILMKTQTSS